MKNEEKPVSYSFWQITKKSKKMETQKKLFEIQPNNSDTAIIKTYSNTPRIEISP